MAVKIPIEDNTTLLNALKTKAQSLPNGGSSGSDIDLSGVTAGASDVLYGKVIVGANGLEVVGTMPNKGAWNSTATSNGSVTIPEGYHNGSGKVTVNVASSSTIPSDGDATTSDVRSGKTFYSSGSKKTGTMSTVTLGTPSIAVSSSGLITAEVTHSSSGYVASGTKQATKQMSTDSGGTITPGTSQKVAVAAGRYTTAATYVKGDANLIESNIKSGVSIFGVTGTYAGGSGGSYDTISVTTSDVTAGYHYVTITDSVFSDLTSDDIAGWAICTTSITNTADCDSREVIMACCDIDADNVCVLISDGNAGVESNVAKYSIVNYIEHSKSGSVFRIASSNLTFAGIYKIIVKYKAS